MGSAALRCLLGCRGETDGGTLARIFSSAASAVLRGGVSLVRSVR